MSGRLSGKIAIVTGAGSRGPGLGNGKATTMLFAREGAKVLCALDILRNNVGIESRKDLLEVIGFVRSIAVQLGPKSIRVNAIAPGPVWTPMAGQTLIIDAGLTLTTREGSLGLPSPGGP